MSIFVVAQLLVLFVASRSLEVETDCGVVVGKEDGYGSSAFLGIPYAMPPVGALRWQPPHSLTHSPDCNTSRRYPAQSYAEACLQYGGPQPNTGSEDCLYLNVWQPNSTSGAKLPVLVFLYGGDLTQGKTSWYNLSSLASEGPAIAVSVAYRVNIFGFFASKELRAGDPRKTSGNYGLLDIQEALRWLQRNIGGFGGDPSRVLLFGQSSGGTAILALLGSPASNGLFSSALVLSGSANITMPASTAELNSQVLVDGLGCLRSNPLEGLECLRNVSSEVLLHAAGCCGLFDEKGMSSLPDCETCYGPGRGLAYIPGLAIVDGVTMVSPLFEALEKKIVDVPLVIQTNAQEPDLGPDEIDLDMNLTQFTSRLERAFTGYNVSIPTILQMYADDWAVGGAQQVYESIVSDFREICGNMFAAQTASKNFVSPVYFTIVTARPSHPVFVFNPSYAIRYSAHFVDFLALIGAVEGNPDSGCCVGASWLQCSPSPRCNTEDAWLGPLFVPRAADLAFTQVQRAFVYELAATGRVNAWIPASAGGQNISNFAVASVPNLKADVCAYWQNQGFGPWEWWAD